MKLLNVSTFKQTLTLLFLSMFIWSCSNDDDDNNLFVNITVDQGQTNDVSGDFTGNGGDGSRTINWSNNLSTADYNADITANSGSVFVMTVRDNNDEIVLERTLNGNTEPDSFSGVTDAGEPGNWTVTITLTNFSGDGSYSLSAGD